jgi:PTH1 family peptidyl-tRNA hydrolase
MESAHTKSCNKKDEEKKAGTDEVKRALIIGLGNPGPAYKGTRHNIGFVVLDRLAHLAGAVWSINGKKALLARTSLADCDVVLMKPQTFMNLSGKAVYPVVQRFGIQTGDIMVIHDDIDLELGKVRLKLGGGDGGHKGVRSIADSLRDRDFLRIRLGVGRPTGNQAPEDYVLRKFEIDERPLVDSLVATALEAVQLLVRHDIPYVKNIIHSKRFTAQMDKGSVQKDVFPCQFNEVVII